MGNAPAAYRAPGLDVLYCVVCRPDNKAFAPVQPSGVPHGELCANCDREIMPVRHGPTPEGVRSVKPDHTSSPGER